MYWFWIFMWYSFIGFIIEKLFAADTSDPKIVKGIFDMARNGNDVPTGRRVRDLAAYRARPEPKQGQGISRQGT